MPGLVIPGRPTCSIVKIEGSVCPIHANDGNHRIVGTIGSGGGVDHRTREDPTVETGSSDNHANGHGAIEVGTGESGEIERSRHGYHPQG